VTKLFTWEAIVIAYLLFLVVALTGCSTFVATTVGDTTYSTGIYLEKEDQPYE